MDRREFLSTLAITPLLTGRAPAAAKPFRRVRPGDPLWPNERAWAQLRSAVGGRLIKLESPLAVCKPASSAACGKILKSLENPYYISDEPAYTQASGWLDAWTSAPSAYAVAAESTADVVAAVNFAREKNLRLLVKGGGHSYLGTSSSPDSLLIWTHRMNKITMHDSFVARGCKDAQPAVTIESGAIWMDAYNEVTTKGERYVQGGGCATVGVAGLIQSGGFGSFSKYYGMAAAALIEAEVVTADGKARIVNACKEPDLFWALKGGGGGTFGVVTKVTLRTRELPAFFGGAFGNIRATSDEAFRRLIAGTMKFYKDALFNRHWGEQIVFRPSNTMDIRMVFSGLDQKQADETWAPFRKWLAESPSDFKAESPVTVIAIPARRFFDASFWKTLPMKVVVADDRPNAPAENIYWMGDAEQPGQFLHAYRSAWLPSSLLDTGNEQRLADAFFNASRHFGFSLHFNKGLAGAPAADVEAARNTATNPDVLDAFALAITASNRRAFPGVTGHEPDVAAARRNGEQVRKCMDELLKAAPRAGSYVSESDFFEKDWHELAQNYLDEATRLWQFHRATDVLDEYKSTKSLIALVHGDYEQARTLIKEGLIRADELGNRLHYVWSRTRLGYVALREGNLNEARNLFAETTREFLNDNDEGGIVFTLEGMAGLFLVVGKLQIAAQLIGWSDALREKMGDPRPSLEQADVDKIIAACIVKMGEVAFSDAYDEGQKMSMDQAVALALNDH